MPIRIARSAMKRRSDRQKLGLGRMPQGLSQKPILVTAECRTSIHPFRFEGHPVGSKVALFKHMGAHSTHTRHAVGRNVMRATIAKEDNVRDPVITQELVDVDRPVRVPASKFVAGIRPIVSIATREIDSIDPESNVPQSAAQPAKQRPRRPLKEQECAILWPVELRPRLLSDSFGDRRCRAQ
jgi:hypothetical protein